LVLYILKQKSISKYEGGENMNIKGFFNKTKYFTLNIAPMNHFENSYINALGTHIEEDSSKCDILLIEHKTYAVKRGCVIKLTGCIDAHTSDHTLLSGEQFFVKTYTGYDLYGENHVVYNGKEYILHWDKKVLKLLKSDLCQ